MKLRVRIGLVLLGGCALVAGTGLAWRFFSADALADTELEVSELPVPGAVDLDRQDAAAAPARSPDDDLVDRPLLPADARPALLAFVDPQADERLPADFHYQVDRVEDADEVAAVVTVLRNRAESDTIRHEAVNLLRRSGYADLEQVLVACLRHPEEQERFRSWAVQHLFLGFEERRDADPAAAAALLVPLLDESQPAVRREALLSLHRLDLPQGPDVVATAAAWLADPATVDLALRILRERAAREYLPQVRAVLADETAAASARIAAIVTLSAWEDHESRAAIAALANLPDQPAHHRLRRSAQMALERLE